MEEFKVNDLVVIVDGSYKNTLGTIRTIEHGYIGIQPWSNLDKSFRILVKPEQIEHVPPKENNE